MCLLSQNQGFSNVIVVANCLIVEFRYRTIICRNYTNLQLVDDDSSLDKCYERILYVSYRSRMIDKTAREGGATDGPAV